MAMKKRTQPQLNQPEPCEKRSLSYTQAHTLISRAHNNSYSKKKRKKKIPKRAYYCNICHTWHLTSKSYDSKHYEN